MKRPEKAPCGCDAHMYCDLCNPPRPLDGEAARIALADAHKALFVAVESLGAALRSTSENYSSDIADLEEQLRINSERLERIFGALALRGGVR